MAQWFTRAQVREQLRALGYTDVSDATLEEFYLDLVDMASREDAIPAVDTTSGHASMHRAGPAAPAAASAIKSDAQFDRIVAEAPGDYVVSMLEELEQMSLDQKAKAAVQHEKDEHARLPIADLVDSASEFGLDDGAPLGGVHAFEEVLADPNYVPTAYIRKRVPRKSAKTDPVRRGEQQRQEQKRYTIPGQNKHTQLRWDVREKLRENVDPPFVRPSHRFKKNDYVVPTDKKRAPLRWVVRQYTEHAR